MNTQQAGERTVTLWIRSFAPAMAGEKQESAIERLGTLTTREVLDDVEINIWGQKVELGERRFQAPQIERITAALAAFERWADHTGHCLEPFFRQRQITSTITDDTYHICRLPTLALAEYEDDELVHVAPCQAGEETITVDERLEHLASDVPDDAQDETDRNERHDDRDNRLEYSNPPSS